jgi:hypothetical protein
LPNWMCTFISYKGMYIHDQLNGILGYVEHYMCWYAIQHKLSLHAHIILWLHKDYLNHVTSDVLTFVPTIYDEDPKIICRACRSNWKQTFKTNL